MTVEAGNVRQIWLAPLNASGTKSSFLIRDDSRSESGAIFGKTIRLGDPVSLGPNSTWKQTSWVGGIDQDIWKDEEMCHSTNCDLFTEPGKVRLHSAVGELQVTTGRVNVNRVALGRNSYQTGRLDPVYLFMGEDNQDSSSVPSGNFRLYRSVPGSGPSNTGLTTDAGITCFSPVEDGSPSMYIGTANGKVWRYDQAGGTLTQDYTEAYGVAPNSMANYQGSLYWLAGPIVRKRSFTPASVRVQTITITGSPNSGYYILNFNGQNTGHIVYNAVAAAVQSALEDLTAIAVGDVTISGTYPNFVATWGGAYAGSDPPLMTVNYAGLGGGTSPKVTIEGTSATTTHQELPRPFAAARNQGICIWNNRIWLGSMTMGRIARVFVSDGVVMTHAFTIPDEFEIEGLIPYNGSLYIYGGRAGADRTSWIGQVYRYTGSSLTKIWEDGTGEDGVDHTVYDAAVNRGILYWTFNGTATHKTQTSQDRAWTDAYTYGLMAYDSLLDAIYQGPSESLGYAVTVRSVEIYNQTLTIGTYAPSTDTWAVRPIAELGKVKRTTADLERWLLSSVYDAGLPGANKVWLKARVRVKIANANTAVVFAVILDEGTEQTIQTISYDASATGWRTVEIPLKVSNDYLYSTTIRYKLYLRNNVGTAGDTGNPRVDSVEIDYLPSWTLRRQWRFRVVATDGQLRLDGSANPLSTTDAIVSKLKDFWAGTGSTAKPFLFWDATTSTSTPATSGTEVMPLTINSNTYRVESPGTELAGEVAFEFFELV